MRVIGLKSCDSCRRALRELRSAGHDAILRDLRADPLDPGEIAALLEQFGAALVNRSSVTWRGLDAGQRELDPAQLLAEHPTLMKRPVIEAGDGNRYLGWGADARGALLSGDGM